ncbi:hypothetical protein BMR07_16570 [Methylococcaceae bacterium CS1]|nr:hypothetical protein BMR09_15950 [Methylococcaceae bacterium CS3]TXL02932.1 hypothetical protein BMR07_16570 [Methylococcaceae bacterium CS1]
MLLSHKNRLQLIFTQTFVFATKPNRPAQRKITARTQHKMLLSDEIVFIGATVHFQELTGFLVGE